MPILFLDFDGVLHPATPRRDRPVAESRKFSYLPRLERVLREHDDWQLVITSSWREHQPWEFLLQPFDQDIVSRVVGKTPLLHCKETPYPRHPRFEEISLYLASLSGEESSWLALDDDSRLYPADCRQLILCDDGFREAEERTLRHALSMHKG